MCRVYDNALANAVMQQAAIILQIEESMPCLRRCYDDEYIHRHCAPLGEYYDDDVTTDPDHHAEMKKLTEQIKVFTIIGYFSSTVVLHILEELTLCIICRIH